MQKLNDIPKDIWCSLFVVEVDEFDSITSTGVYARRNRAWDFIEKLHIHCSARFIHMFDDQRNRLLKAIDEAHDTYYRTEIFGGPSLHFHLRSLDASREQNFERFAEYVYAVLPSWGMHRTGARGSKMRGFEEFRASLQVIWPAALRLKEKVPASLNESDWLDLKTVFCEIRCMATRTSLVGNSKVMAHLLPNLIPPVDREYTLKLLYRSTQLSNDIEVEWTKLVEILKGFFYPIDQSPLFQSKIESWLRQSDRFKCDTSRLKILDNLVIGFQRWSKPNKSLQLQKVTSS